MEEDKCHGKGQFILPDGAIYEGDWQNNKRHGIGQYIWPNGNKYEGEW